MIIDLHALGDTKDAESIRLFFADVLNYPFVDEGEWLVMAQSPAELGITPANKDNPRELYLICDDLDATVKYLQSKEVEITRPISETEIAYTASIRLPGGGEMGLCQKKDQTPAPPLV
ncbi:MAG: extradiol dioxygenase [Nitrososphaerales archaeon]|jgi:predicted enzyme related to lactoylglutathione lyase